MCVCGAVALFGEHMAGICRDSHLCNEGRSPKKDEQVGVFPRPKKRFVSDFAKTQTSKVAWELFRRENHGACHLAG